VQAPNNVVAIKAITKKNLAKSQNLLGKEIKILKVSRTSWHDFRGFRRFFRSPDYGSFFSNVSEE
jgi:hypothetical protein